MYLPPCKKQTHLQKLPREAINLRSSNPVLNREASFTLDRYGAGSTITMDSIIMRSAILLGTLVASGAAAWVLALPMGAAMVMALVALVIGLVATIKKNTSPLLFMIYAVLQGGVVGTISRSYESAYSGIVIQAVLGVIIVFGVMLTLYKSRVIRVTNKFTKIVLAAGIGFIALMLINLVAGFFVDGGLGLRDGGPLAIGFSILGVVIGALFYALDFDQAERLIAAGVPEKESWRVGFGLLLTTVWIYLEILRLLSYFRD